MTLKPQLDKTPVPVAPKPAWGDVAEPGESLGVIRFECKDGAYSYPYHVLARWVLHSCEPQALVIQVGKDIVTVQGRNLETIRDVLDASRLRVLRASNERYAGDGISAIVTNIGIEALKSPD